jgi:hypothetical protein
MTMLILHDIIAVLLYLILCYSVQSGPASSN